MPQTPNARFSKNMTRMSDSQIKNIIDTAKRDNNFLGGIPTSLTPSAHKTISSFPMVGGALSQTIRGVEKKMQEPISRVMSKNLKTEMQADNEQWARGKSGSDRHTRARFHRELLGVKNDSNDYGKSALGGSNKSKGNNVK
jgi:hypothetical protein